MNNKKYSLDSGRETKCPRSSNDTGEKPMSYNKYNSLNQKSNSFSVPIQKGLWLDEHIGNTREKLEELYTNEPQAFQSEKSCIISYWSTFENLSAILGDKWEAFSDWFLKVATSPETITRCRRDMKQTNFIKQTRNEKIERQEKTEQWRQYWRNNGCVSGAQNG